MIQKLNDKQTSDAIKAMIDQLTEMEILSAEAEYEISEFSDYDAGIVVVEHTGRVKFTFYAKEKKSPA